MMSDPEKERRAEKAAANFLRRHLINASSETLHTLQQACAQLIRVRARLHDKAVAAVLISAGLPPEELERPQPGFRHPRAVIGTPKNGSSKDGRSSSNKARTGGGSGRL
jgi:hypothetical protein